MTVVQMVSMRNGKLNIINDPSDFEKLIDKCMGSECAAYYHRQIKELSEYIKDLSAYVNDRDVQKDTKEVLLTHGFE